jgi:segregation and condensation protein B
VESLSKNARLVEVLLYLENEPLSMLQLMRFTSLNEQQIHESIDELSFHYQTHHHGLIVKFDQEKYQLAPNDDLHDTLREAYGKKVDKRLSRAALETLSIIAYAQPVTRRDVESIRGVSSDTIIRLLLERDYIKVVGKKEVPGRPMLLGTTKKFLFDFNLNSISALPKLSDIDRERFIQLEE